MDFILKVCVDTVTCTNFVTKHACWITLCPMLISIVSILLVHAAVQILFVPERQHWVATAYHDGEVHIYDSCFPGYLCPSTEEQLVRLYRPAVRGGTLMVTANSIQQQEGSTDCGVFSVAAAYHCAMGDDFGESHLSRMACGGTYLSVLNVGSFRLSP